MGIWLKWHGIPEDLYHLLAVLTSNDRTVVVGSMGRPAQQLGRMPDSGFRAADEPHRLG